MTRPAFKQSVRELHVAILAWTSLASIPAMFALSREGSAVALAALVILPVAICWYKERRLLIADPIVVLGAGWILAVSLPVLFPNLYKDRMWQALSPWSLDTAAIWMYRGWAACCVTYWGGRVCFRTRDDCSPSAFDLRVQFSLRRWIGVFGLLGTLGYILILGGKTYQVLEEAAVGDSTAIQVVILFSSMAYVYTYLYFWARAGSRVARIDTYLLVGVLAAQGILFIGAGSKFSMIYMTCAYFLGNAIGAPTRRIWHQTAVAAAAIGLVVFISFFVAAYRGELVIRPLPPREASTLQVLAFQFEVAEAAFGVLLEGKAIGSNYYVDYDSSFILDRFAHLASFALVLEYLNGVSPFENALASVFAPVFAIVPRDFFPDKVHFVDSGDFAQTQGWTYGGIGLSIPGSLFWAWGYAGILLGMGAVGLIAAALQSQVARQDSAGVIWRSVLFAWVLGNLDTGTTFQMIVVPVTRVLLLLLLVRLVIRLWPRTSPV